MDGDDRRPRFFQITEEVYYDERAPIHDDHMVTIPACLNVGSQQSLEPRRHHDQVPNATYFANQAHYVALLMHHEVVAQEVPEEQLDAASPFHEDYWDDYLTVLEATRIEEQRQVFQGSSPPIEDGTAVTASLDGKDSGAEPLSASTLMGTAKLCRVEMDNHLFGDGALAANYIMQNVDEINYDFFPVETYGLVDEEEFNRRLQRSETETRIAHAVGATLACTRTEANAVVPEKRRDYSAGHDHCITVELDGDAPNYFVVKTMVKPLHSEMNVQPVCIDQQKIGRHTGKSTVPALHGRLLDERQSETDLRSRSAYDDGEAAEELPTLDDPMLIIDEWEEIRLLLAGLTAGRGQRAYLGDVWTISK